MLEQIEKKQQEQIAERETPRPKTIGAKVPPDLYAKLARLKEREGLKSMKEALLLAAQRGVSVDVARDAHREAVGPGSKTLLT